MKMLSKCFVILACVATGPVVKSLEWKGFWDRNQVVDGI